jgi:peptidoglycan hydrolase-like protein with peptidoglycan-binding domain
MPTSQNGWPANNRDIISTYTVPGTSIKLALRDGPAATVLLYVASRFNREIETLHPGWNWGYAERPIRGSSTTLSNHASGTAIDLNAPAHPMGVSAGRTFSLAEITVAHAIEKATSDVVRWGGDWVERPDGMHWEIVGTPAQVQAVATRLTKPPPPKPAPTPYTLYRVLKKGCMGNDVTKLQAKVGAKTDGDFGPKTEASLKTWQSRHKLYPDGICGPKTAKSFGWTWKGPK